MDTYKLINRKQYDILRDIPSRIKNEYAAQILKLARKGGEIRIRFHFDPLGQPE